MAVCKPAYKHAGWVVFEHKEEETDLKARDKEKEDHSHFQQIKLNKFTVSLWHTRKEVLYPITIAIKANDSVHLLAFMPYTSM